MLDRERVSSTGMVHMLGGFLGISSEFVNPKDLMCAAFNLHGNRSSHF